MFAGIFTNNRYIFDKKVKEARFIENELSSVIFAELCCNHVGIHASIGSCFVFKTDMRILYLSRYKKLSYSFFMNRENKQTNTMECFLDTLYEIK